MMKSWHKRLLWLLLPLAVIGIDQWTKALAREHIDEYGDHVDIIDGFFRLNRVQNEGAAFGLFSDLEDGWREVVLTSLGGLALVLVVVYSLRLSPGEWFPQTGLHMICAGAIGNLVDRFTIGSVTDFLEFYFQEFRWPAFNIADTAIVLGVAILLIDTFLPRPKEATAPGASPSPREGSPGAGELTDNDSGDSTVGIEGADVS